MRGFMRAIRSFLPDDDGVTALEYALLVSLIVVAVIFTVTLIGNRVDAMFQLVCTKMAWDCQ